MKELIAYCGLDCEKCDARTAFLNNDDGLREKTAKLWSELNGVTITKDMIDCAGCRTNGKKTPYCSDLCPIRKCAVDKGFSTCGDCGGIDCCETVRMITGNNNEALHNLKNR